MAKSTVIKIGLIGHSSVLISTLYGFRELFDAGSQIAQQRFGKQARRIETTVWQMDRGIVPPDLSPILMGAVPGDLLDILIVPPAMTLTTAYHYSQRAIRWLQAQRAGGAIVASACGGAFVLGAAGFLDGRPVTTHWHLADQLLRRYPTAQVDADQILIDDGDLITAGGITAWMDLGLRIAQRFLGAEVAIALSRLYLVNTGQREQRSYRQFVPYEDHGDEAILKAQRWLAGRIGQASALTDMARVAGLATRTFQRRFEAATGYSPTTYLQRVRVGRAADLLIATHSPIDEVAWNVGYEDSSAFRKVFKREMSLAPGAYRKQFQLARSTGSDSA